MSGPQILTVGDNVVDCYPDLGVMFPGGNAVNVAVHARRCGVPAGYLGVVGADAAGELVRRSLQDEDVDSTLLLTEPGPNAYAVVRVVDGNRVFESGEIGVSRIPLGERDYAAMGRADLVHTGECSMVEDDLSHIADAAAVLSFDFSERPWDYVRAYARYADVAVVSAKEGAEDPAGLAARVAALGPRTVAVTQGSHGATLLVENQILRAPAGHGPVVDTLGAGDAFIARLLVGIVRGERPEDVLPAATSYATGTCATHGAFGYQTPLPKDLFPTRGAAASP